MRRVLARRWPEPRPARRAALRDAPRQHGLHGDGRRHHAARRPSRPTRWSTATASASTWRSWTRRTRTPPPSPTRSATSGSGTSATTCYMNNPRQYAGIKTVADRGIKFDLIMGNPIEPGQRRRRTSTRSRPSCPPAPWRASRAATSGTSPATARLGGRAADPRSSELYAAAKANPATADAAGARRRRWRSSGTTSPLGDLSQYADYANGHMYPGGYKPSNEVSQITTAIRGSVPATKPLITTEAGYHNATEHDQRPPAGARGRRRRLHAAGAARALPARARSGSTPTS